MALNRAEQNWPDIDTTNINEDDARLADAIRYAEDWPRAIEYGKSEHGFEFPVYAGELLSWSIGLYATFEQEQQDYPKMRTLIRAMKERRPEQLEKERIEMLKGSFDSVFGGNARKVLAVIESEREWEPELEMLRRTR